MSTGHLVLDPIFAEFVETQTLPELIVDGFISARGPVWMNDALYFNDTPAKKMHRWSAEHGLTTVVDNNEFASGATADLEGRLVSCEQGGRRVVRREDPASIDRIETLAERFEGRRLNSPCDVVVRSDGAVWFTDPPYGINSNIEGYPADREVSGHFVYCMRPNGPLTPVAKDFERPSGLAFSPDERRLYVADSGALPGASFQGIDYDRPHHIRALDLEGCVLRDSRVFAVVAPGAPYGLRVDMEGYVWSSSDEGVHCYAPNSTLIGKILVPGPVSNLCFGGPSGSDLFITALDAVWRVRTRRTDATRVARAARYG